MTGINSIFYVCSSIPPWWLTDHAGRRPILLWGAVAMAIALSATGWWIYIDLPFTPKAVVACVIIYNFAFGMSWGPIPWLYPPEIMPLPFRAKGVSLSTATVSEVAVLERLRVFGRSGLQHRSSGADPLTRTGSPTTGSASPRPCSRSLSAGDCTRCMPSSASCHLSSVRGDRLRNTLTITVYFRMWPHAHLHLQAHAHLQAYPNLTHSLPRDARRPPRGDGQAVWRRVSTGLRRRSHVGRRP
jgi:hypothetical protein